MLICVDQLEKLNFGMLMQVYEETNLKGNGQSGLLDEEQSFYQYLREIFFKTQSAFYAIWVENSQYVSALRIEPYKDGLLLAALETKPSQRRKRYASLLIDSVLAMLTDLDPCVRIYAHVHKENIASQRVHVQCGFRKIADFASFIDGSVSHDAYTFCFCADLHARG